jgi:transglutaminase-like putative cysteine protease
MVAVPFECAEQEVRMVDEDFSRHVDRVTYRDLDDGARQMLITVPMLGAGETATAIVTFEVKTQTIEPPDEQATTELSVPKRPERTIRKYLTDSPFIEVRNSEIRSLARQLWREAGETSGEGEPTDWQRIEHLYDYMLENIHYSEGPDKSAADTLRDKKADCHGRSALFIALCRANKVPARVVWVNNHCYAEFYLEDPEGAGTWYPIESAGTRSFGGMPLARTILQKGDDFKVPERRGERLRYASDFLVALPVGNSGKPKVKYIRELVE